MISQNPFFFNVFSAFLIFFFIIKGTTTPTFMPKLIKEAHTPHCMNWQLCCQRTQHWPQDDLMIYAVPVVMAALFLSVTYALVFFTQVFFTSIFNYNCCKQGNRIFVVVLISAYVLLSLSILYL